MKYSVTVTGTFEATFAPNGINISLSLKENEGGEKNTAQNEASSGDSAGSSEKKQNGEEAAMEVANVVKNAFDSISQIVRDFPNKK